MARVARTRILFFYCDWNDARFAQGAITNTRQEQVERNRLGASPLKETSDSRERERASSARLSQRGATRGGPSGRKQQRHRRQRVRSTNRP